jgi:hypothetical protein
VIKEFSYVSNQTKKIYWLVIAALITNLVGVVGTYIKLNHHIHLIDSPYFSEDPPLKRFCFHAVSSLIFERPADLFFHKDILQKLDDSGGASYFDFEGDERVIFIKYFDKDKLCKVYIENKNGIRAFRLPWSNSGSKDLKITDIDEFSPTKNEWEG